MPEQFRQTIDQKKPRFFENIKKPVKSISEDIKKSSGRPIEQILVGTWDAVKKYPEWWGKQTLDLYDRLKFPKFTPEEKKMADKTHAILKKYQKEIGWTETSVQAAVLTFGVVKGFRYLRDKKLSSSLVPAKGPANGLVATEIPQEGVADMNKIKSFLRAEDLDALDEVGNAAREAMKRADSEHKKHGDIVERLDELIEKKNLERVRKDLSPFEFVTNPQEEIEKARMLRIPGGGGISTDMRMHPRDPHTVILTPAAGSVGHFTDKMRQRQEFEAVMNDVISVEVPHTIMISDREYHVARSRGYTLDVRSKGFVQGSDEGFFAIPMCERVGGMRVLVRGLGAIHGSGHYVSDVNGITLLPNGKIEFLDTSWLDASKSDSEMLWQAETGPNSSLKQVLQSFITRNNPEAEDNIKLPFLQFMIDRADKFRTAGEFGLAFNAYTQAQLNPLKEGQVVNFMTPKKHIGGVGEQARFFDWSLLKPLFEAVWKADNPHKRMYTVPVAQRMDYAMSMTIGDLENKFADMMAKKIGLTS